MNPYSSWSKFFLAGLVGLIVSALVGALFRGLGLPESTWLTPIAVGLCFGVASARRTAADGTRGLQKIRPDEWRRAFQVAAVVEAVAILGFVAQFPTHDYSFALTVSPFVMALPLYYAWRPQLGGEFGAGSNPSTNS